MLIKEQVQSQAIVPPLPGSFAGLMEMHETNYLRLRLLLGNIRSLPDQQVLEVPGHLPLQVSIKERCRHTTVLMLTYWFSENTQKGTRPDLLLRVYHDARQVEVISHKRQFSVHPQGRAGYLALRWRMNRFLYKWLGYLHFNGYSVRG